jgi:hypothetical protein
MMDREPTIRARELGLALSRAAEAQDIRVVDMARRLGWPASKVSRLYSGKRGASTEDVSAVLAHCGITGPKRAELMDMARHANERGWWQEYGTCLPPELRTLSGYEDAAIVITNFENTVVPGLLQIPTYMRALLDRTPAVPARDIPTRVAARMRRQMILDRRYPAKFVFYLDEYALMRTGPGEDVMSSQIHHILRLSVRPHIEIRIIPDHIGFHAGRKPFHLMQFSEFHPIVFIENDTSALFLEHPDPVHAYHVVVANLDNVALSQEDSRDWLAIQAAEFGDPREDDDDQPPPVEEDFSQ